MNQRQFDETDMAAFLYSDKDMRGGLRDYPELGVTVKLGGDDEGYWHGDDFVADPFSVLAVTLGPIPKVLIGWCDREGTMHAEMIKLASIATLLVDELISAGCRILDRKIAVEIVKAAVKSVTHPQQERMQ